MDDKYIKTHDYIVNRWKDGIRENKEGDFALPFPFEPPSVNGTFKYMFYWDTFYTNRGMIIDGKVEYAIWNTSNLIYLLNKYGYVPNSNSIPGIKNTQPPYLHFMIEDIYNQTKDDKWLKDGYKAIKKEYDFWMSKRVTPIGLNRYFHCTTEDEENIAMYDYVTTRLDIPKDIPKELKIKYGSGYHSAGEGGLDFSPRYGNHGDEICPVCLNSILYLMEANLAKWAKKFEPNMVEKFEKAQENRLLLMNKYLLKDNGLYYDYNFVKGETEQTEFCFTGQFWPFIAGLSTSKENCKLLLSKLEFEYGIAATEPYSDNIEYQAAYPYSFPYDNGLCFWALETMHMVEDAKRVGYKYLNMCANSYLKTGILWECYNAIIDEIARKKEYPNTEMMGWTAGIYEWIYKYITEN